MKSEAQRIAIAEACGWTIHQITCNEQEDIAILPPGVQLTEEEIWRYAGEHLPDYLNDLNAMHEAEKVLNGRDAGQYDFKLDEIVMRDWDMEASITLGMQWHATAAQRAEAFLRCVGKWEKPAGESE